MKHTIEEALDRLKAGQMVILVDDEDRENEGDLVVAAQHATPEAINFMATHGRGLICLAMTPDRCDQLGLPPMVSDNTSQFSTAFTVSIEAKKGVTTGISVHDRSHTILTAVADDASASDLARPGHVFPLRAKKGGVLVRAGQTEGSVDLARLAGLKPAGVICEIMNEDGTMARLPDLKGFSEKFQIPIVSIADLIAYRLEHESLVEEVASSPLPSHFGQDFTIKVFESKLDQYQHVVLTRGTITPDTPTLVRVHSECFTGDVMGSLRCDCQSQLHTALEMIAQAPSGVLLYLRQEGRGIGLVNKIKAYALQDQGHDTVEANEKLGFKDDLREYGVGAQILKSLGVGKMTLLTNNPRKLKGLEGFDLEVVGRKPIEIQPNETNKAYLQTKKDKLGHLLKVVD
jgi:3,4-dihydroxy 2-butanone 4-phosphate synthase/GTP cyclohydrolase II